MTTYRSLSPAAQRFVAALDAGDPLAAANHLIDRAVSAQDSGDLATSEALLADADSILANL